MSHSTELHEGGVRQVLHFGSQPLYAAQPAGSGGVALTQQALSQQYSLLAVLTQAQQQLGLAPPAATVVSTGLFAGFPAPQLQVPAPERRNSAFSVTPG